MDISVKVDSVSLSAQCLLKTTVMITIVVVLNKIEAKDLAIYTTKVFDRKMKTEVITSAVTCAK